MAKNMDLNEPVLERELRGHKSYVTCIELSPNGKQIASGDGDNALMIWPLSKKMTAYKFSGHKKPITDLSYNPSGTIVATSSLDSYVRLWVPTVNGKCTMLRAHLRGVRSVKFSPDGSTFATASDDKIVKLWNAKTQEFVRNFKEHKNWVRRVRYSRDSTQLASCSDDKTSVIWDIRRPGAVHTFYEGKGIPNTIEFHPQYDVVGVGLATGAVKLYDLRMFKLLQFYEIFEGDVTDVAFDPNGTFMIAGSKHDTKVLDLLEGRPLYNIGGHVGGVSAVSFSSDGHYFATGGMDGNILLWRSNLAVNEPSAQSEIEKGSKKRKIRPSIVPRSDRLKDVVPVSPKPSPEDDEPRSFDLSQPEEELEVESNEPQSHSNGSSDRESPQVELEERIEQLENDLENLSKENENQGQQLLAIEANYSRLKVSFEERLKALEERLAKANI